MKRIILLIIISFCCSFNLYSKWYDGKKLWTNYYVHKAVIDIAVHSTNDMPTSTATVTVSNSYHNLDRVQGGLDNYSLKKDVETSHVIEEQVETDNFVENY